MKALTGDIANFIEFLDKTPTPFHVFSELYESLEAAGCKMITLSEVSSCERGKPYCIPYGDSALLAFFAGESAPQNDPGRLLIGAAHVDYPVFKIKNTKLRKGNGVLRMNIEMYGGTIVHPWLDRALKIAGRVYFKKDGKLSFADIGDFGKRFVIPNAAIHMNRSINDGAKFSIQNQLLPFFGLESESGEEAFAEMVAAKVSEVSGIGGLTPKDIMSFDLSLVIADGASLCGASDEFVLAQGLDDRGMIYTLFSGFNGSLKDGAANASNGDVRLAFAFNHEECGSETDVGAKSAFASEAVKAIAGRFFPDEHYLDVCRRSLLLSADMGHATHPSFPEYSDSTSPIELGKGIVLKTTWNQSYATKAEPMAEFASFCEENDIPFQRFSPHSDNRGGGTIGPMLSASLGIRTCDIGIPLLAMHSPKELGTVSDHVTTAKLFKAFFS